MPSCTLRGNPHREGASKGAFSHILRKAKETRDSKETKLSSGEYCSSLYKTTINISHQRAIGTFVTRVESTAEYIKGEIRRIIEIHDKFVEPQFVKV